MPLLNIHLVKGRSEDEIAILTQTIHEVMVASFGAPERDRYQIITEHESGRLVMLDTGLGFERTDARVLIHMTTRPRTQAEKETFYARVVEALGVRCGIGPNDIMVSAIENSDADWSFGFGKAQFLTGDL